MYARNYLFLKEKLYSAKNSLKINHYLNRCGKKINLNF